MLSLSLLFCTYHADWYDQPDNVQHPVPYSRVLKGMLQRFIVTKEAAFIWIPKQKEQKYGKTNCKWKI